MKHLRESLSSYWLNIQASLFPWLEEELGALTEKQQQLVSILELVRVEAHLSKSYGLPGRPPEDRAAIARSFVAKMVFNLPTTVMLIDRLESDKKLRRICGWERRGEIPGPWTFSRAFHEFSESELPSRVHAALIERTHTERLVGHISRDSTEIKAREKSTKKREAPGKKKGKKGRGRPSI